MVLVGLAQPTLSLGPVRPGNRSVRGRMTGSTLLGSTLLGGAGGRLQADRERLGIDLLIVRPEIAKLETRALEASLRCLATEIWPEVGKRKLSRALLA